MKKLNPNKFLFGVLFLFTSQVLFSQNQNASSMPSGFPVYENTGNKEKDEENYKNAKLKWIKENPEEYKKLNGGVGLSEDSKLIITEKEPVAKEPFIAIKSYELVKVEAIAVVGLVLSEDELKMENENVQNEFPVKNTFLNKGSENSFQFTTGSRLDMRGVEKRNNNELEWYVENKECASCSKSLYLTVELETEKSLMYVQKSEDADSKFMYRFYFELMTK